MSKKINDLLDDIKKGGLPFRTGIYLTSGYLKYLEKKYRESKDNE